jgi:hypothetical protein
MNGRLIGARFFGADLTPQAFLGRLPVTFLTLFSEIKYCSEGNHKA